MTIRGSIITLAILLNVQVVAAQSRCFKAINPEAATVEVYSVNRTESGLSADLKLNDPTQETPFEMANLLIQTPSFTFQTMAFDFGAFTEDLAVGNKTYSVECDGGNMKVSSAQAENGSDILSASSDRVEGDIIFHSPEEGCSLGNAKFKQLMFEQVLCASSEAKK